MPEPVEFASADAPAPSPLVWERLCDLDPNGILVASSDLTILAVNPAFCSLFAVTREEAIGRPLSTLLDDHEQFQQVWRGTRVVDGEEWTYPDRSLRLRRHIIAMRDLEAIACILIDQTHTTRQRAEMGEFRRETVRQAREVIDRQMKVVQEIASLLGETAAETKISLLRLVDMVDDMVDRAPEQ